jgi:acyl-CoA thioester hydrolase
MSSVIVARERVRYAETDRMGVAYNPHFLVWFEVGRGVREAAGLPYRELEAAGYLCQSQLRGELHDAATATSRDPRITRVRSREVVFDYEILGGRLVARSGPPTRRRETPARRPSPIFATPRTDRRGTMIRRLGGGRAARPAGAGQRRRQWARPSTGARAWLQAY